MALYAVNLRIRPFFIFINSLDMTQLVSEKCISGTTSPNSQYRDSSQIGVEWYLMLPIVKKLFHIT